MRNKRQKLKGLNKYITVFMSFKLISVKTFGSAFINLFFYVFLGTEEITCDIICKNRQKPENNFKIHLLPNSTSEKQHTMFI